MHLLDTCVLLEWKEVHHKIKSTREGRSDRHSDCVNAGVGVSGVVGGREGRGECTEDFASYSDCNTIRNVTTLMMSSNRYTSQ